MAGWLGARRGGLVVPVGGAFAAALLLPWAAPGYAALLPALFVLGAVNGALDVLMNAHAARVEAAQGRPIMSSFHACWSLGGLLGRGRHGIGGRPGRQRPARRCGGRGRAGRCRGLDRPDGREGGAAGGFVWPSRAVAWIGALCFLAFMTEGAVADWSGVFLMQVAGATAAGAAAGFAGFSAAMVLGRVFGDWTVRRLGPAVVLRGGAGLAAAGFGLAVAWPAAGAAGFALVGLGVANMAPLLFSAAGRAGPAASTGVAAVATLGYAGLLLGPPMVGAVSDVVGLRGALGLLVVAAGVLAAARLRT